MFDGSPEVVAGTYVADGFGVPFEITIAEDGWSEFDGFALVKADEGFVSFWSPTHVPGDACGWQATNGEVAEQLLIGWSHTSTRTDSEAETMLVMDLDGERAVFIAGSFAAPSAALEEELSANTRFDPLRPERLTYRDVPQLSWFAGNVTSSRD